MFQNHHMGNISEFLPVMMTNRDAGFLTATGSSKKCPQGPRRGVMAACHPGGSKRSQETQLVFGPDRSQGYSPAFS